MQERAKDAKPVGLHNIGMKLSLKTLECTPGTGLPDIGLMKCLDSPHNGFGLAWWYKKGFLFGEHLGNASLMGGDNRGSQTHGLDNGKRLCLNGIVGGQHEGVGLKEVRAQRLSVGDGTMMGYHRGYAVPGYLSAKIFFGDRIRPSSYNMGFYGEAPVMEDGRCFYHIPQSFFRKHIAQKEQAERGMRSSLHTRGKLFRAKTPARRHRVGDDKQLLALNVGFESGCQYLVM